MIDVNEVNSMSEIDNTNNRANDYMYIIDEFAYNVKFDKFVRSYVLKDGQIYCNTTQLFDYCYAPVDGDEGIDLYDPHAHELLPYKIKYKTVRYKELYQARKNGWNMNDIDSIRRLAVESCFVPGSTIQNGQNNLKQKTTQEEIDLPIPSFIPAVAMDIEVSMDIGSVSEFTAPITAIVLSYNTPNHTHFHRVWLNSEIYSEFDVNIDELKSNDIYLKLNDEKGILTEIYLILSELKAVLVTFYGCNFDFPYFVKRCEMNSLSNLFGSEASENFEKFGYSKFPHLDLHRIFSNTTLKLYMFGNSYEKDSLDEISQAILKKNKIEIDFSTCSAEELVKYNANDGELTLLLFEEIINSLLFLCRTCCTTLFELQNRTIMTWITNAMNYMYQKRGYLIRPYDKDKPDLSESQQGGFVMSPPKEMETDVYVLDFASEYPTIVGNYNLGQDTVNCGHEECKDNIMIGSDASVFEEFIDGRPVLKIREKAYRPIYVCTKYRSIYSDWVETIRDFRVNVAKRLSKTDPRYRFLNGACKVFLNGSVGLYGTSKFHYSDSNVFNAVTRMGQFMLYTLSNLLRDLGFDVVYGATDSCFFKSPYDEQGTMVRINKIIQYIKEKYKLDLELEKKFKMVFFSGRKSNYLAVSEDGKIEIKGLSATKKNNTEWIRNNFDEFINRVSEFVKNDAPIDEIKQFVKDHIMNALEYIRSPKARYEEGELNPYLYTAKWNDREYKAKPQHIRAAELVRGKEWKLGDEIVYFKSVGDESAMPVEMYNPNVLDVNKYEDLLLSSYEPILQSVGVRLNIPSSQKSKPQIKKSSKVSKRIMNVDNDSYDSSNNEAMLEGKGSLMYFITNSAKNKQDE